MVARLAPRLAAAGITGRRGAARQRRSCRARTRGARDPRCRRAARDPHLRQRRPGRAKPAGAVPERRADRRLRRRHQPDHLVRRAGARLRLQAAGIRRAGRGASAARARPPGPAASRCIGATRRTGPSPAMWSRCSTNPWRARRCCARRCAPAGACPACPISPPPAPMPPRRWRYCRSALRRLEPGAVPVEISGGIRALAAALDATTV